MIDELWKPISKEQLERRTRGQPLTHRLVRLPHVSRRTGASRPPDRPPRRRLDRRNPVWVGLLAFLGRRPDNRFMQMMRRRVLAIAFSLALLALVSSGGSGSAATEPTATVVVVTSGVVPEAEALGSGDYGYADYGLVLRNCSSARDALDVTVEVEAVDARGQSITDSYTTVTLIPAGADFVISGALIWRGAPELGGIETEIHVGQKAPRRRRLPRVKHVSVASSGRVIGSFANPYKKPLPASATIYGLFSTAWVESWRPATISPTQSLVPVRRRRSTFARGASTTVQRDAATSAKVSVDPCGYLVFNVPVLSRALRADARGLLLTVEIETARGLARADVRSVDEPRGVLCSVTVPVVASRPLDLTAATQAALSVDIAVALIEQPYRVAGRRAPPRPPVLDAAWISVVGQLSAGALAGLPIVAGGRSMGGRVACRTAEQTGAVGVLCLAFPLEPPRRESGWRCDHPAVGQDRHHHVRVSPGSRVSSGQRRHGCRTRRGGVGLLPRRRNAGGSLDRRARRP